MANTKKVKKKSFTIEDLNNLTIAFEHLVKDEKCYEFNIFGVKGKSSKLLGIEPIKVLKHFIPNGKEDSILASSILPPILNVKEIKNKLLDSVDICDNFIRFNFK